MLANSASKNFNNILQGSKLESCLRHLSFAPKIVLDKNKIFFYLL